MTTDKRRRELARAKAERQAQRRAEASARARRNRLIGLLAAGAVVAGAVVWAAWPDSTEQAGAEATPEAEGSPTPDESASPTAEATPGPVATPAGVTCTEPGAPRNDGRTWDKPLRHRRLDTQYQLRPDHGRAGRASSTQERQRTGIPHRPGLLLGQLLPPADHCRDLRPAVRLPRRRRDWRDRIHCSGREPP